MIDRIQQKKDCQILINSGDSFIIKRCAFVFEKGIFFLLLQKNFESSKFFVKSIFDKQNRSSF